MAFSKFINPKKKRRVNASKESPYPVPLETDRETGSWFYYTGFICGNHVEVRHTGDIERLYKMGFFGKGTLSRSKPEFNKKYRTVQVPNSSGEIITARVMSRRSYLHRLKWKTEHREEPSNFSDYDSSEEMSGSNEPNDMDTNQEKLHNILPKTKESQSENESKPTWLDFSKVEEVKDTGNGDALWEEDADFWGIDSVTEQNKDVSQSNDGWNKETVKGATNSDHAESRLEPKRLLVPTSNDKVKKGEFSTLDNDQQNLKVPFDKKDKISFHGNGDNFFENLERYDRNEKIAGNCDMGDNSVGNSGEGDNLPTETSEMVQSDYDSSIPSSEKVNDSGIEPFHENNQSPTRNDNFPILETESDLDSFCKSDDDDGNLFVVDDSDSEPEYARMSNRKRRKKKKWRPVLKRDPLFIRENLHLSFEEAFFLSYGLGCLVLKDENQMNPDLTQLWELFRNRQKSFVPNYVAYHYYRSKGWVPKTGLKFGSDLLIYKEGPAFYHGSYSVIVKMVLEDSLVDDLTFPSRDLSWTSLAGLNRLTEQVAKEVLICYVVRPKSVTDGDLVSPKCIQQFKVKEMLLSRWVSSQEREKHCEDMP